MSKPLPNEELLIRKVLEYADDPLGFVLFAFPWGEPGPLQFKKPRKWQVRALKRMRDHLRANRQKDLLDLSPELFRLARASGRGIGKSAILAWVGLWMFTTVFGSTTIVSANTEGQLKDTTFPEIKKWASMSMMSHWFDYQAMSIKPASWLVTLLKETTRLDDSYWYIQARLWSEENPDAYAGPHSQLGMAVLFDEASGISANIWPVAQGYFTDKTLHRIWVAISNTRNPTGEFFNCFHVNRGQWDIENIDARTVEENDAQIYEDIIARHGPDSDEARVEVYGQFPRQGDKQFIGRGLIEEATGREIEIDVGAPLLMGVDPARFGDDSAGIRFRQGRNWDIPGRSVPKSDIITLANVIAGEISERNPDAVFIEGDGVGGGLIDVLRDRGFRINEVSMGGRADDSDAYADHRTECWDRMKEALPHTRIANDSILWDDLAGPMYDFTQSGKLKLESVRDMKKRGLASPNNASAFAVTFSRPIARRDRPASRSGNRRAFAEGVNYSVLG